MTIEALTEAIKRLIEKRRNATEQQSINEKLTKLYDIKYLLLEQQKTYNQKY